MLLSLTLANNQTLYQFLHATETPLAIVAEPDKLNELLTSSKKKLLLRSSSKMNTATTLPTRFIGTIAMTYQRPRKRLS